MEEQKEPAVEPVAHEAPSSSTARSLKDLVAQMILSEEKYGWELNKVITVSYISKIRTNCSLYHT